MSLAFVERFVRIEKHNVFSFHHANESNWAEVTSRTVWRTYVGASILITGEHERVGASKVRQRQSSTKNFVTSLWSGCKLNTLLSSDRDCPTVLYRLRKLSLKFFAELWIHRRKRRNTRRKEGKWIVRKIKAQSTRMDITASIWSFPNFHEKIPSMPLTTIFYSVRSHDCT